MSGLDPRRPHPTHWRWGARAITAGAATLLSLVASAPPASAQENDARDWLLEASGHSAEWRGFGPLSLPSGSIFIGDPSWGDDHHMRGAQAVSVDTLGVWLLVAKDGAQVHAAWLEADGGTPAGRTETLSFGTDSAYFAFGDLQTGQDLVDLRDLGLPEAPDSFEFFLPHIQNFGFTGKWLTVPPSDRPVFAVETKRDGGLEAVWLHSSSGGLSGILIDITGRAGDGRFLDKLIDDT